MKKIIKYLTITSVFLTFGSLTGCGTSTSVNKPSKNAQKFCEAMQKNDLELAMTFTTEYTRTAMSTLKDVPRDQLILPKDCNPVKEEIFGVNKDSAKVYFKGEGDKLEELNMVYVFKLEDWQVASKK